MIDFTNPDCSKWYVDHLESRMTEYGIDGFKFDAGELSIQNIPKKSFEISIFKVIRSHNIAK
jgi:alpha-glucosidase (family GH31 glycosyl hydrolase)